jgi:hypothetical protein
MTGTWPSGGFLLYDGSPADRREGTEYLGSDGLPGRDRAFPGRVPVENRPDACGEFPLTEAEIPRYSRLPPVLYLLRILAPDSGPPSRALM